MSAFPTTPRQAVLWLLAPVLLLGVAGWHSYQVAANDLTPWEGGGFGMFSTVDKRQARFVRCHLITPTDTAAVPIPGHLDAFVERLRALPTSERAHGLAQYLSKASWVPAADSTTPAAASRTPTYRYRPPHDSSSAQPVAVKAVRITVWRYRFESSPFGLTANPLVEAMSGSSTD